MTWAATATERIRGRRTVYYLAPTWGLRSLLTPSAPNMDLWAPLA
jgi:hypothetical protein